MKHDKSIISRLCAIMALALFAMVSFTSCSDDDEKTPLQMPTLTQDALTVSTLAFHWDNVKEATQYAYELIDPRENVVLADVTQSTSLMATGLKPNTEYTLKVWAFSAFDSDKTTSPIAEIKATTGNQIPLVKPSSTDLSTVNGNGGVTVTWSAVEHATGYKYTLSNGRSGTTYTNSVLLTGLELGEHTITIVATSDDEVYSDSEPFKFTFKRERAELWRKTGTYTMSNMPEGSNKVSADIVAYDDGSFCIEDPYGKEGYSINFTTETNEEGKLRMVPFGYDIESGFHIVNVTPELELDMFCSDKYSYFYCDEDGSKGNLWFWAILYNDNGQIGAGEYDQFDWGWTDEEKADEKEYNIHIKGYDYFGQDYTRMDLDYDDVVSIRFIDDTHVKLLNFYGWTDEFLGVVDYDAKTITFEPATWNSAFTFASKESVDKPVVATFEGNLKTIYLSDFTAWYGGNAFIFVDCVLKRK